MGVVRRPVGTRRIWRPGHAPRGAADRSAYVSAEVDEFLRAKDLNETPAIRWTSAFETIRGTGGSAQYRFERPFAGFHQLCITAVLTGHLQQLLTYLGIGDLAGQALRLVGLKFIMLGLGHGGTFSLSKI